MSPRPKVLILSQPFYPELVATGLILTELAEALSELGVEVKVLCGPPTIVDLGEKVPRSLEYHGINIRRVWGANFPKLNVAGMIINFLTYALGVFFHLILDLDKRPILVVTNPPFLGAITAIMKVLGRHSYIYLIHDVYPDAAIKLGLLTPKGTIARIWEHLNQFILTKATAIVVIGRCMKQVILDKGKGIKNIVDKVHFIPIWGDVEHIKLIKKEENPFFSKWNLDSKFIVLYSGNMGRLHDMETIMAAAKELAEYKDILFLFIGDGYKKKWMEDYAQQYNLTNCQFHNYVDRQDLSYSISCAHVALVSLLPGQEGFSVPSKTFTMLSAAVPVIGIMGKNNEIAFILSENNCGMIIEPGDVKGLVEAIYKLSSDHNLRELMGNNGREIMVNKYNLISAARQYKELIQSLPS